MLHFIRVSIFAFVLSVAAPFASQATVILDIDGTGKLTGARNVDLGQLGLFDVGFVDGTCIAIFSGCDDAEDDFAFQTAEDATTAAQALLDQVFLDVGLGTFDTDPELTRGCSNVSLCVAVIPFTGRDGLDRFIGMAAHNSAFLLSDTVVSVPGVLINPASAFSDFTGNETFTFAVFSPVNVPEPATLALFGIGLAGLGRLRRRNARHR